MGFSTDDAKTILDDIILFGYQIGSVYYEDLADATSEDDFDEKLQCSADL